jgi:flagellar export protein FliJ
MAFRFRLSKVLDWYDRQYQLEASRLQQRVELAAAAQQKLANHRETRLEIERQMLQLELPGGSDFRAREFYRRGAMLQESHLITTCHSAEKDLETQRLATVSAQRKLRLVEKLRERRRGDFEYVAARELEEISADSWLAGFARNLREPEY